MDHVFVVTHHVMHEGSVVIGVASRMGAAKRIAKLFTVNTLNRSVRELRWSPQRNWVTGTAVFAVEHAFSIERMEVQH